jgi:hypothetical protein
MMGASVYSFVSQALKTLNPPTAQLGPASSGGTLALYIVATASNMLIELTAD